jgi:hypothetical protein
MFWTTYTVYVLQMKHTSIWWTNSARPFLNDVFKIVSVWVLWFVEQSKLMARILVEIAIDIVDFMMGMIF